MTIYMFILGFLIASSIYDIMKLLLRKFFCDSTEAVRNELIQEISKKVNKNTYDILNNLRLTTDPKKHENGYDNH